MKSSNHINTEKWIIALLVGLAAFLLFNRYTMYSIARITTFFFPRTKNTILCVNDNLAVTILLAFLLILFTRCLLA